MAINFNQSPYYDDYSDEKDFYRILFRPGFAVQARELTQLQTILQKQVGRFGNHIFKEGSIVAGGQLTYSRDVRHLKLQATVGATQINGSNLTNKNLVGDTSGARIYVIKGFPIEGADPNTIIGTTLNGISFVGGEDLIDEATGATVATIEATSFFGDSSLISINDGVFYVKGTFVFLTPQTIALDKYSNNNSYIVGLNIVENIITSETDSSLLDNAQGSYNFTAPGANRFKITLTLSKTSLATIASDDFIEIARISSGNFIKRVSYPTYGEIEKTLARRTFDESGDYTVKPFKVAVTDHVNGNTSLFSLAIDPGKAYVKGFEYQNIATEFVDLDRSQDVRQVLDELVATQHGNYLHINAAKGFVDVSAFDQVELHNIVSANTMTDGTKLGTARVKYLKFDEETSSTSVGNNEFKLYLMDIRLSNGAVANIKSVVIRSGNTVITRSDVDIESKVNNNANNDTILSDTNFRPLLFQLPSEAVKTVRDDSGTVQTSYNFQRSFKNVTFTSGSATITTASAAERFLPGTGTLSNASKQINFNVVCKNSTSSQFANNEIIRFDFGSRSIIVNASGGSPGTATLSVANAAASFVADIVAAIRVTNLQERTKTLTSGNTVIATPSTTPGGNNSVLHSDVYELDYVGDLRQTITSTGANTYSFTFTPTQANTVVVRVAGTEKTFNTHYTANSSTITFTVGNVPSVSQEIKLYNDITTRYSLDTGQRDAFYDHGAVILNKNAVPPTGTELYAKFQYFAHSGAGYLSVDSYTDISYEEIPTFISPSIGAVYNLRDTIDFRPRRADNDLNIEFALNGGQIPDPDGSIEASWQYYLPRIDKLVLTKDREFRILKGISNEVPVPPLDTEDGMTLYVLEYPAYSFSPRDVAIDYIENKRYTMRDIGRIEKRLENLEYYTALSLLEKQARDEAIVDASNVEIFKNGILVDPFAGHSVGDVTNIDYQCSIDFSNRELRPSFASDNYRFTANTAGLSNTQRTGNLVTLTYSNTSVIEQPLATKSLNVNPFNVPNWTGTLLLNPPSDTWFDTETRPEVLVNLTGSNDAWEAIGQALVDLRAPGFGTQWNDWQTIWSGEEVIDNEIVTRSRTSGAFRTTTTINRSTVEATALQSRTGITTTLAPRTITTSLGNRVVNVSVIPFIRSQGVLAIARGMKPSTRVYPFFDNINVTSFVTPANKISLSSVSGTFRDTEGNFETVVGTTSGARGIVVLFEGTRTAIQIANVTNTFLNGETITGLTSGATGTITGITVGSAGGALNTNSSGEIAVVFTIPNTTQQRFRTGERLFRLLDTPTNTLSSATTRAESPFQALGILQTVESLSVSTRVPVIRNINVGEGRVLSDVFTRDQTIGTTQQFIGWVDPLAQTFLVDPTAYPNGIFTTSIRIFFKTKDSALPVTLQIRPTVNGYPSSSTVIPFSEVIKLPADVNISDSPNVSTAGTYTEFTFPSPVYLPPGEYAIVLLSNSIKYEVYVAEIGQPKLNSTEIVSDQPYAGSLFKSQNGSTWTPEQNEDLMFVIRKAVFSSSGTALFDLEAPDATFQYDLFNVTGSNLVFSNNRIDWSYKTTSNTGTFDSSFTNYTFNSNRTFSSRRRITGSSTGTIKLNASLVTSSSDISPVIDITRLNVTLVKNQINNLPVEDVVITSGGSGYLGNPTVSITGVGSGAVATATRTGNTVSSITVSTPGSGYFTTPSITITPTSGGNGAVAIISGETDASGGNALARYITRRVTLADGFDAQNLNVVFSAYKPVGVEIFVYYKVLAAEDNSTFDNRPYVVMNQFTSSTARSTAENEFLEFKYVPSATPISYESYTKFKTFAIKIVMSSSNPTVVPRIRDLRVLALDN